MTNQITPQIILASASPRRAELLRQLNLSYLVEMTDIDETPYPHETPADYVTRLSQQKALTAQEKLKSSLPILAADTVVVLNHTIMGKPADDDHAIAMLQQLSNQMHYVLTAITLVGKKRQQALSTTSVFFKALRLSEIIQYVKTGEPMGKAGSYAIQGLGSCFIERIQGSYSGVMGLPLFETSELLAHEGIEVLS
jgi:septum formation protein